MTFFNQMDMAGLFMPLEQFECFIDTANQEVQKFAEFQLLSRIIW